MFKVQQYFDAGSFLEKAEKWLLCEEAENNLLLGIAGRLVERPDRYKSPVYLATIEENEKLVGCAFRTPPYKLGLTRMPESAVPVLVNDVCDVYTNLPAVLGPENIVKIFAESWGERKGVSSKEGKKQRIFRIEEVISPECIASGNIRAVEGKETDIVEEWLNAFHTEVNTAESDGKQLAEERILRHSLFFWDDGRPVSMAGCIGRTPNGVRISFVYTPPVLRGNGYATACITSLSKMLLGSGIKFCFLYTDLSNHISNSIYRKIGYKPVCDVMDYNFI